MPAKLKILIVDDSVVVRRILTDALGSDPALEVSCAANGRIALSKIPQFNPDLVTLDMEMPEMDGLETLREIRKTNRKLPVIMFSTLTERGAAVTLDALAAGANDYVTKPANVGSVNVAVARIKSELIPKIKSLCGIPDSIPQTPRPAAVPILTLLPARREKIDVIAIGTSTGGPNALSAVIPLLPKSLAVPVVIVQHMPPIFTKLLADRLSTKSGLDVKESVPGMVLRPGQAVIAAGGSHMIVKRRGHEVIVESTMDDPENSCRPAVDVLFRSVAKVYGASTLALIMTGMGNDGLRGCTDVRLAGGQVIVQDERTSVIWSMPGVVAKAGLADKQLPLPNISEELVLRVDHKRETALAGATR